MLKLRFCNKEHGDVWLVEPAVMVGSDASCQAVLKRDGVQPRHIQIQIKGDQLTLVNLANDKGLLVNGKHVDGQVSIQTGDEVLFAGMNLVIADPKNDIKPATQAVSSGWAIRAKHSALANKVYPITSDTTIGRAPECDLNFSVTHLSRKHAQLYIRNGQFMVKDLGSANGTFVNGNRLEGEARLNAGDELRLDTLSFTVVGPDGDAGDSNDSEKTVMRAAISLPVSPAKAAPAAVKPSPVHHAADKDKKVAGVSAFNKAVTNSEAAKDAAESSSTSSTSGWLFAAIGLIAVIAVIGYVIFGKPL